MKEDYEAKIKKVKDDYKKQISELKRQLSNNDTQMNQLKQSVEDYEDFIETNKEINKQAQQMLHKELQDKDN